MRKVFKIVGVLTTLAVLGLVVMTANVEAFPYVSTFNITEADFSLTGFSWDHDGEEATDRIPTLGPNFFDITNITGTYDLNIPPAGDFLWHVSATGGVAADFNKDGTWDAGQVFDKHLGNFVSWGPSTSWGPSSIPFTVTHGGFTLDFTLGFRADLDGVYPSGPFGTYAFVNLKLSDDPPYTEMFLGNTFLTAQDNLRGGGDGIIDGWMKGDFTVTAIPEPATLILLGTGLLSLIGYAKKKKLG